ncbi:MAG: hypothetical protein ACPGAN_05105 [Candidatus Poseidoniaceae archaeon]
METKLQRFERLKKTLNEIESLTRPQNTLVRRYNQFVSEAEDFKKKLEISEHKISETYRNRIEMPGGQENSEDRDHSMRAEFGLSHIEYLESECSKLENERKKINRRLKKKHDEFGGKTYSEFMQSQKIEHSIRKDMAVHKNKMREAFLEIALFGGIILLVGGVPFLMFTSPDVNGIITMGIFLVPFLYFIFWNLIFPIKSKEQVLTEVSQSIEDEMGSYESVISKHIKDERRKTKIGSTLKEHRRKVRALRELTKNRSELVEGLNHAINEIETTLNSLTEIESEIREKYGSISEMIPNS